MKTTACLAAALVATTLAGCQTGANNVNYGHITRNLSPELNGLAQRRADARNSRMYAENANWRSFNDDLARVFLIDHPSRLTPYPVVDVSGQPR